RRADRAGGGSGRSRACATVYGRGGDAPGRARLSVGSPTGETPVSCPCPPLCWPRAQELLHHRLLRRRGPRRRPRLRPRRRALGRAGPHRRPGRPRAQPEGRGCQLPAGRHGRVHGSVRLGQVLPGLRHDLRRGPAALRRVALLLRPHVPGPGGQAGRGLHRGPVPGRVHRPEVHQPQPALHSGDHHRDLRLHAPALGTCRGAALPAVRRAGEPADPAADRGPARGAARAHPLPGARARGPRPQGRVRGPVQGPVHAGLRRRGRGDRPALGPARAEEAGQAHHRRRRGPPRHEGGHPPAPHRLGGDRPEAGGRPRRGRVRGRGAGRREGQEEHRGVRRAGRRGQPPVPLVLREALLPQRARADRGRDRAALVLLQQPVRRVPRVHRHRLPPAGGPGPRRRQRRAVPARGRRRAVVARQVHLGLLAARARRAGQGDGLLPGHPVEGPDGGGARRRPARQGLQGGGDVPQPVRPRAPLHHGLRGRHPLRDAQARGDRVGRRPRALRVVHAGDPVPGVPRGPPQPHGPERARGRPVHRGRHPPAHARGHGVLLGAAADGPGAADRGPGAQGDPGPAGVPAGRRPRVPQPRAAGRHPLRRRGPAHPPGHTDRLRAGRRPLRPRRAVHRPAPAGQPPPHRDPPAPAGPRQHPHRRRARRGHDRRGGLDRGHRPSRGRVRRRGRALGLPGGSQGEHAVRHRRLPLRPPLHRGAGAASRPGEGARADGPRRPGEQPEGRLGPGPARGPHGRDGRVRLRQVHADQRDPLQGPGQPAQRRQARARPAPVRGGTRAPGQGGPRGPEPHRAHATLQPRHLHGRVRRDPQALRGDPRGEGPGLPAGPVLLQHQGRALRGVRGRRHAEDRDELPAGRLRAVRGVPRGPVQPGDARGHLQGQEHRRGPRHADRGGRGLLQRVHPHLAVPGHARRRRSGLRPSGPARHHALGRRGPAREAGGRAPEALQRPHHLRAGRADHGVALRRHPQAPARASVPRGQGQHGAHHRAQPRRDQERGPRDRPRPGGRLRRRHDRGHGHAGGGRARRREPHGPVPRGAARVAWTPPTQDEDEGEPWRRRRPCAGAPPRCCGSPAVPRSSDGARPREAPSSSPPTTCRSSTR
nr:hypothetical 119.5K protein (uvrA region) - Micrococcus luteus [Micrococcus luteus]